MHRDYAANSAMVTQMIRAAQKRSEDNSTQEKHLERCRIAVEVHGWSV